MTPKIRVSPAATRNSVALSCTPLRNCSTRRVIAGEDRVSGWAPGACVLHLAGLGIGVALGLEDPAARLQRKLTVAALHHLQGKPVLDGMLVGAEGECAAHRLEIRFAQRCAKSVGVGEIAM